MKRIHIKDAKNPVLVRLDMTHKLNRLTTARLTMLAARHGSADDGLLLGLARLTMARCSAWLGSAEHGALLGSAWLD